MEDTYCQQAELARRLVRLGPRARGDNREKS